MDNESKGPESIGACRRLLTDDGAERKKARTGYKEPADREWYINNREIVERHFGRMKYGAENLVSWREMYKLDEEE